MPRSLLELRADLKRDQDEYSAWLKQIRAAGADLIEVNCDECEGDGEVICLHCGDGHIDCEECGGTGKKKFPNLSDYQRMKRDEKALLEMWAQGKAIPTKPGDGLWFCRDFLQGFTPRPGGLVDRGIVSIAIYPPENKTQ